MTSRIPGSWIFRERIIQSPFFQRFQELRKRPLTPLVVNHRKFILYDLQLVKRKSYSGIQFVQALQSPQRFDVE